MELIREIKDGQALKSSSVVVQYLKEFENQDREMLIVLGLDTKNKPIYREIVSIGTLNEMYVHPREVFKKAIMMSVCSIIIAHNHPSGDPNPSEQDRKFTSKLIQGGKLLGIDVLDHVVIGSESYYSFNDMGDMNNEI